MGIDIGMKVNEILNKYNLTRADLDVYLIGTLGERVRQNVLNATREILKIDPSQSINHLTWIEIRELENEIIHLRSTDPMDS